MSLRLDASVAPALPISERGPPLGRMLLSDRWAVQWLLALLVGALSVLFTGYTVGQSNNVFHLPIVAGLYDLPQFADDAFVQSLRGYLSGLWMLLGGVDRCMPAPVLFPAFLVLSRALTLGAAWAIARELGLGLRHAGHALAFMALLSVSPLMHGIAYAGHGALFVPYFTHSELANGLTLCVLLALLRARPGWALGLNGAVLFVNAFMAVWNLLPVAVWLIDAWYRAAPGQGAEQRAAHRRSLVRAALAGLLVMTAFAIPLGIRAVARHHAADGVEPVTNAQFAEFLAGYFPYHFFAASIDARHWLALLVVLTIGAASLWRLGSASRALRLAWLGYLLVYAVGVALPWFSNERLMLNLHLLRVSVNFHLIAAIGLAALTLKAALVARHSGAWLGAALLLFSGFTHRLLLVLAAPLLMAQGRRGPVGTSPAIVGRRTAWTKRGAQAAAGLLALASFGLIGYNGIAMAREASATRLSIARWTQIGEIVRLHTAPEAQLLIPPGASFGNPSEHGPEVLEYAAQRRVWVDSKRGAAVMWAPTYLAQWRQRMAEVRALPDWPAKLQYAQAQGIAVVIDHCAGLPAGLHSRLIGSVDGLCALRAGEGP